MTADVFDARVLAGLLKLWWGRAIDFLVVKAPQWLFQGLLIVITFFGFRAWYKTEQGRLTVDRFLLRLGGARADQRVVFNDEELGLLGGLRFGCHRLPLGWNRHVVGV